MSEYHRTQVYLEPAHHQALRRLAAERRVSMTAIVREAVAMYLRREIGADQTGLVDRMQARLAAGPPPGFPDQQLDPVDARIGEHLYEEHLHHIAQWEARHRRLQAS